MECALEPDHRTLEVDVVQVRSQTLNRLQQGSVLQASAASKTKTRLD